ncbi:MAG TPA: STAS domain-containing protein, partial [Haliangiales bacterium]|nr:STAS domain-containing protein [Haliangiales bacterium]
MKLEFAGQTLRVTGINILSAASAPRFRDELYGPLATRHDVEVDLSRVEFMDSHGLGALIWARKTAQQQHCRFRLLNPAPRARILLDLTLTRQTFDIVDRQAPSEAVLA